MIGTSTIRVMLVDDHEVVREGLTALLGREPGVEVVGAAGSAADAMEALRTADPDVVVVDLRLPDRDGIELTLEIAEQRMRAQVVVLSAFLDEHSVDAALMAGARAYVVKDVEAGELVRAIRAAARGETMLDPKVAGRFMAWASRLRLEPALPPSRLRVLELLAEGRSASEIAQVSGLTEATVRTYLRDLYRRLGVGSRAEAAAVAARRGLIGPPPPP